MRKPDEIMAEYLLKGGKMLAKTCPSCHSPLFEYKGETFCVVCREEEQETDSGKQDNIQAPSPSTRNSRIPHVPVTGQEALLQEYTDTIQVLLRRIQAEGDSKSIKILMQAVKDATEAYALLAYGYGCRERS